MATSPLKYLKDELNFSMAEWNQLTDKDKSDLKEWAQQEIDAKEQKAA